MILGHRYFICFLFLAATATAACKSVRQDHEASTLRVSTDGDSSLIGKVTHKVFLEISVDDEPAGRIVLGLFGDDAPKAVKNFRSQATGEMGRWLHYRGTYISKVVPWYIQGGATAPSGGTGGVSIYGGYFEDETFKFRHDSPGLLGMTNNGPNTNASQFYITLSKMDWLYGRNVIFGRVLAGMEVLSKIQDRSMPDAITGVPQKRVVITNSGEL